MDEFERLIDGAREEAGRVSLKVTIRLVRHIVVMGHHANRDGILYFCARLTFHCTYCLPVDGLLTSTYQTMQIRFHRPQTSGRCVTIRWLNNVLVPC